MDCLEAQRIVSEKLDRMPVDASLLESAKEHCRTCPDCAGFVRALLAVGQVPLPHPPDELPERIMAAIRRESAQTELGQSRVSLSPESPKPSVPTRGIGEALRRLKAGFNDPRNERTIIAWTVTAAVVTMVAGIGATMGVRMIFSPSAEPTLMAGTQSADTLESAAPREAESKSASSSYALTDQTAALTSGGSFITVSGTVYRAAGPAVGVDAIALKPAGTTVTALDGTYAPRSREVLKLDDPARVYLTDDAGALLGFDRVTRTYEGRVYVLKSRELSSYGQWPALPSSVQRPQGADGSPAYRKLGTDSSGVPIFGLNGSASQGILVAPGTTASDPAAGNPDWTWWSPIAQ